MQAWAPVSPGTSAAEVKMVFEWSKWCLGPSVSGTKRATRERQAKGGLGREADRAEG